MPSRKRVIDSAAVNRFLDKLAEIMARSSHEEARRAIPLWKRLVWERDRLLEEEAILAKDRQPVTFEEIETFFDLLARLMHKVGKDAVLYVPIWRALERGRDEVLDEKRILDEARLRHARNQDR